MGSLGFGRVWCVIQALPIPRSSWDFCLRSRMETFPRTLPLESSPRKEEPGLTSHAEAAEMRISSLSDWQFTHLVMQNSPSGSRAEEGITSVPFLPVTPQATQKNKAEVQIGKLCLVRVTFLHSGWEFVTVKNENHSLLLPNSISVHAIPFCHEN